MKPSHVPSSPSPERRNRAKPYILAGALGVVAGLLSVAFAVLRR